MTFSIQLKRYGAKSIDAVDRVRRRVIIELFSAIIRETPVDTGRLRSNWQITLRSPATGTLGIRDVSAVIAEAEAAANASKGDDVVIMRNNLPYAYRIEYEGWSKQAPEGMVRRNIAMFQRIVNRAARK